MFLIAVSAHAAGAAAPNGTQASGIWRCGSTYSDQPCPGGRAVDADDPRSASQQRAGEASAREARRHADAMARERQQAEARAARQGPAVIAPPPAAGPRPMSQGWNRPRKPARHDGAAPFTARDPSAPAGAKKHRRKKREG